MLAVSIGRCVIWDITAYLKKMWVAFWVEYIYRAPSDKFAKHLDGRALSSINALKRTSVNDFVVGWASFICPTISVALRM
jgi:hypothetical protein